MFQCCLEMNYTYIHLHLHKFMIFFLFYDLVADKMCTYLRTSTQSLLIQTHQHNSPFEPQRKEHWKCSSSIPSTVEQSDKPQGEGVTLDRMINGSAHRLCCGARQCWHHLSEWQRHIQPGTEIQCQSECRTGTKGCTVKEKETLEMKNEEIASFFLFVLATESYANSMFHRIIGSLKFEKAAKII